MLECQVGMQSDTQARKAQAILQRYGYSCRIQRQVHATPEGCSYLLQTKGLQTHCRPAEGKRHSLFISAECA